jgi:hypothetical protein
MFDDLDDVINDVLEESRGLLRAATERRKQDAAAIGRLGKEVEALRVVVADLGKENRRLTSQSLYRQDLDDLRSVL